MIKTAWMDGMVRNKWDKTQHRDKTSKQCPSMILVCTTANLHAWIYVHASCPTRDRAIPTCNCWLFTKGWILSPYGLWKDQCTLRGKPNSLYVLKTNNSLQTKGINWWTAPKQVGELNRGQGPSCLCKGSLWNPTDQRATQWVSRAMVMTGLSGIVLHAWALKQTQKQPRGIPKRTEKHAELVYGF